MTFIQLGNQGRAHTCIGRSCSLPCLACLSPGRHELPVDRSDFTDDEYHGTLRTSWPGCTIDGSSGSLWIDANNAISNPAYEPLTSSVHLDFDAYQFTTSAGIYAFYPPCSAPTYDPIHSHIDSVASLSTADPTPTWGLPAMLVTPSPHSPIWPQAIPPQAAAPTGSPIERSQPIPAQTERRSRCGCHHLFQRHSAPLPVRLFAISFTLPTLDVSMYSFRGLPR